MSRKHPFISLMGDITALSAAIRALFVRGEQWTSLWDHERYSVRGTDPHGYVILDRLRAGQLIHMWPHENGPDDRRHETFPTFTGVAT